MNLSKVKNSISLNTLHDLDFSFGSEGRSLEEGIAFSVPPVKRKVFPGVVELKAHSSYPLSERDPEIFYTLQAHLTPYLQEMVGTTLKGYNLEIVYYPGEDASRYGVVVTNMNIKIVLTVESNSIETLSGITHEGVDEWLFEFFSGSELYEFVGDLRRTNVEVNEIVFLEESFRSPIFGDSAAGLSNGASSEQPKKSKAGLFSAIFVALVVAFAIYFVNKGDGERVTIPGARSIPRSIPRTIRRTNDIEVESNFDDEDQHADPAETQTQSLLQKATHSIRGFLRNDGDPESGTAENDRHKIDSMPTRTRSFLRHPPGGIKPAAIQKAPAFSKDYLEPKSAPQSSFDDQSISVQSFSLGGDYNVPAEYDFSVGTPVSDQYSNSRKGAAATRPRHNSEEEFSMPEDYNTVAEDYSTVNDEQSLYSRITRTSRLSKVPRTKDPKAKGPPTPTGLLFDDSSLAPSADAKTLPSLLATPKSHGVPSPSSAPYLDEWSVDSYVDSYKTPSPSHQDVVPYKGWDDNDSDDDRFKRNSPGRSALNMPRLR